MAQKRTRNLGFKLGKDLLNNSLVKIILAVVATGSFAIAFGQEKIAQLIPFTQSTQSTCLKQFYRSEPPYLSKASLQKNTTALCFNGFNVMYSGVSKTPLWSAEYLSPARLSQKIKREDSFHEETRLRASDRAVLSDYKGSGYDRGHMSPNADMPDKQSQADSFSLANMVPQAPKNNQQVWRELEEATRAIVTKQKQDVYVVTGPVFSGQKLKTIGNGVIVPTAVFKAIYMPASGKIGVYLAPNNNSLQVKVVSVCQLEELVGINIFPQLTEEQKRNTYSLPLKASQVQANQEIAYSHWDAESQCAEAVSAEQLAKLQKQFKAEAGSSDTSSALPKANQQAQQDLGKQLSDSVVQYLLHLLK